MSKGRNETEFNECVHHAVKHDDTYTLVDASKLQKAIGQCAKQQTRIIGGEYTAFREYPWMVSSLEKKTPTI